MRIFPSLQAPLNSTRRGVEKSPLAQMSDCRSRTIWAVVERPGHHDGDDLVLIDTIKIKQMAFALDSGGTAHITSSNYY